MSGVGPISQLALQKEVMPLKMVRQNAQAEQQLVSMITEAVDNAKVSETRGQNINQLV